MKSLDKLPNLGGSAADSDEPLRVAICGIRGIPACYGGFETFAEELGSRLASDGVEVCVYGREHVIDHAEGYYKGVEIRLLPAPQHKYLETPVHTLRCLLDLARRRKEVDAILVCNAANSPFIWIARVFGMPIAVNLDGIERLRKKWNFLGRSWYLLGEICSVLFANVLISDADMIREYYKKRYKRDSLVLRYGSREVDSNRVLNKAAGKERQYSTSTLELFESLGVEPGRYILYVSRLEPENNAHRVVAAYNALPEGEKKLPLLIVGDAPYSKQYISDLHESAGDGVIFAGFRFGDAYEMLQDGAHSYVQATEVGGTHPALVEAMGFGNCVIANDTPEHREVLGDSGLYYRKNDVSHLTAILSDLLSDYERVCSHRKLAFERCRQMFSWDSISRDYRDLFYRMAGRKPAPLDNPRQKVAQ